MTPFYFLFLLFNARGVVMDPAARPIQDATVVCGAETTTTNARGEFEISRAGCDAKISKDGFAPQTVALIDGKEATVTMKLAPTSDRVVVTATGSPVTIEDAGVSASVFTPQDFAARGQSVSGRVPAYGSGPQRHPERQ